MKTASDPRHKIRQKIVQDLFANSFASQKVNPKTHQVLDNLEDIDKMIAKAAPDWPIDKINKIDLAILRLATYELMENKLPHKVVIDEAIELAKEYGSEASFSFVNGVLGTIIQNAKF